MGDAALEQATGRSRAAWYALLDDADALAESKDAWRGRLARLAVVVARPPGGAYARGTIQSG